MRLRPLLAGVLAGILTSGVLGGVQAPSVAAMQPQDVSADPTVAPFTEGVTRLSGATRYETAVAISQRYAPGPPVLFVATGNDFPDALSASAAAAFLGGPLLLTPQNALPTVVRDEVARLGPQQIYVVGGAAVVSEQVRVELAGLAPTARLAGSDRYDTGRRLLTEAFAQAEHAMIATGGTFPDALSATGAAGARRAPVVLVDGARQTVPAATIAQLERMGVTSVSITGGPGAVTPAIERQLSDAGFAVTRYGGATRFETSSLVNQAYFPQGSSAHEFLATGLDYPDALAGAALAGHLAAPLHLTRRSCVDPVVGDSMDQVDAGLRVVLGGMPVLAPSAAAGARCVHPVTSEPLEGWSTSGWALASDIAAPYSDRPPVDVANSQFPLDSTGLLVYRVRGTGERADHPVAYAQYGISALLEYERTGDDVWLQRAVRHGERLTEFRVERDGAWWYPYGYTWTYYTRSLTPQWWSAMAQGQALSLFVRLAEATGEARWDGAADRTWASFSQPYSATQPWSSLVIDDHLYFEEYAGDQLPLLVLNGHIFAIFGLYDYWRHTGDTEAARYLDGGATSVLDRMMPLVRVQDGVSHYCVQAEYCHSPLWQHAGYHVIHSWQLDTLARITSDARFTQWAELLREDWVPASLRSQQLETGPRAGTGADLDWIEP